MRNTRMHCLINHAFASGCAYDGIRDVFGAETSVRQHLQ